VLTALARTGIEHGRFRWAAVVEATAEVLRGHGITDVFVPSAAHANALAAELPLEPGDQVLLPHADIADRALAASLGERGARVTEVVAYETREAPESSRALLAAALDDGPVDALVLASGSTARGLVALVSERHRAHLLDTPVIASGATTAEACLAAGYPTVLTAPAPDAASLAAFTAFSLGLAGAGIPEPSTGEAPSSDPSPSTDTSGGAR
jgi:uroporphyrinogen-III synthase